MARKKHTVEQISGKLREAEVALSKGQTVLKGAESYPRIEPVFHVL